MPFVRPTRWQYWVFTYLIPIIPLMIFWDGVVSHLRTYSTRELDALTADIQLPGYGWETRRVPLGGGAKATVLIGMPETAAIR
jgi:hypothetical protein